MVKRAEARPVTLTPWQRDRLERLWFHFGNYGSKSTPGNHSFIQRLLENGYDERPLIRKRTPKSQIPTPECEAAVDAILAQPSAPADRDEPSAVSRSRILSQQTREQRPQSTLDPELKEIRSDMKRRDRVMRERLGDDEETPDAA